MVERQQLPDYQVNVINNQNAQQTVATLTPCKEVDILSITNSSNSWNCNWQGFWDKADWDCEAIVLLKFENNILGLIHFGIYPYPSDTYPEFVYIDHLECLKKENREVTPVGSWLIWYATKIAIQFCQGNDDGDFLLLDSVDESITYYRNIVKMEGKGWTTIAPGEEGYAFKFTQSSAKQFCQRIENEFGIPRSI